MTKVHHRPAYHFVWATRERLPLITPIVEEHLFPYIRRKCNELGYRLEAVNGTENHLHLLVRLPPAVAPSIAAKRLKGASSHFINRKSGLDATLYWQRGFSVFSVGERDAAAVRQYVLRQKEHHESVSGLIPGLERPPADPRTPRENEPASAGFPIPAPEFHSGAMEEDLPQSAPTRLFPGYVLDLDGTIFLGDALLPGAERTVEALRAAGSRVVFLSNKPLQTRADYAAKLTRLGIPTTPDEVVNSSWVLARWLGKEAPGSALFVVGEQPLLDELRAAGFRLTEQPGEIEFVVASFDRTFEYRKLQIAFDAIRAGARFIATNADRYCPVPEGGLPDAAAVIGAIEGCTGKQVEVVVGKPSPITVQAILDRLELQAAECIMIGDRLETDVRMGREAGMATAVVLTGVTTPELLAESEIQPDYVLRSLDELLPI